MSNRLCSRQSLWDQFLGSWRWHQSNSSLSRWWFVKDRLCAPNLTGMLSGRIQYAHRSESGLAFEPCAMPLIKDFPRQSYVIGWGTVDPVLWLGNTASTRRIRACNILNADSVERDVWRHSVNRWRMIASLPPNFLPYFYTFIMVSYTLSSQLLSHVRVWEGGHDDL